MLQSLLLSCALASSFAAAKLCPPLGPVFEPPTGLADSPILQDAFEALKQVLDNATETGETLAGPWASTNNSFSIGIFDLASPEQLFSYQWSSPALKQSTQGVTEVSEDSIYRIGSASKLISAYVLLIEAGPSYWNEPVTKYIPELKAASTKCPASEDQIDCTDWNSITLGALASHMSGGPREYSTPAELLGPLSLGPEGSVAVGLPPLPKSAIPPCGLGALDPCTREQYLAGYTSEAPAFAPFTTPLYSNAGYALLGLALEKITGRPMSEMVDDLFQKLNMTRSSATNPDTLDNAVYPLGIASGYEAELGVLAPAGGYFSTQTDLVKLGKSILGSTQLSPSVTRQWMKPVTFTESYKASVGYPWEIFQVPDLVNDHKFDLYTKSGDLEAYSSNLILSPAHNVGIVLLAAGNDTTTTRILLAEVVAAAVFPAVEKAARSQAHATYAGSYKSASHDSDFEVVLATQAGRPGLSVQKWVSNGTDSVTTLIGPGTDVRLYPTNLVRSKSNSISYRAVYEPAGSGSFSGIFAPECETWYTIGAQTYGGVALDEVVFTVEDGVATAMAPRAWRTVLNKAESISARPHAYSSIEVVQ